MQQTVVVCEDCGNAYAARAVDEQLIVATHDGDCSCGNDTFTRVVEAMPSGSGTAG